VSLAWGHFTVTLPSLSQVLGEAPRKTSAALSQTLAPARPAFWSLTTRSLRPWTGRVLKVHSSSWSMGDPASRSKPHRPH
jgi:hypothetical protein